ncbi:MAG: hypothetical protein RLZZ157_890 [Pseudomonadota bacterium]|jgi:very-short-patch-repair endonuclease
MSAEATKRARGLRAQATKAEQHLWQVLKLKRPDGTHWRRQVMLAGFSFDFGCHGLKLLVEVDGGIHNLPDVQLRDRAKAVIAREHGYTLIRIKNEDIAQIETAELFDRFVSTHHPEPL